MMADCVKKRRTAMLARNNSEPPKSKTLPFGSRNAKWKKKRRPHAYYYYYQRRERKRKEVGVALTGQKKTRKHERSKCKLTHIN